MNLRSAERSFPSILIFLIAVVAAPATWADAKTGLTLDDIARIKSIGSMLISPDGQSIAFIENNPRNAFEEDDGPARTELKVIRNNGPARRYGDGEIKISNVVWAPDSNALYYLGKGKDDKQNKLYAIPLDGGAAEKVCQLNDERSIDAFDLHPDGQQLVLVAAPAKSEQTRKAKEKGFDAIVYEEAVKPAAAALVALNAGGEDCQPAIIPIDAHVASANFSPDGKRLLIKAAPTPHIDDSYMQTRMRVLNLEGGEVSRIANLGKLGQAIWSPDSAQLAFIGVNDFNDPREGRLKIADPRNGRFRELFKGLEGHIIELAWAGPNSIYALVHIGVESEVWRVDLESAEREIIVPQGQRVVTHLSASTDGSTLALLGNSPQHPNELFRWRAGKLERLTDSNPWLAGVDLGQQELVQYKARDGLDLQGLLIYPTNYRQGKRYPLIAYVHGGPESHRSNGWLTNYSSLIQVAAAQGYVAFVPNYRGSTGRGVEFSKLDQHAYATPEFDDIVDGKNHLVELGLVDRNKVGITGGSYGGYATAWSATALSEHYAAGVMFVGISNQISKFGTTDIAQEMHAVHSRAWPWEDWQFMLERSPIYHAENSKTPLLIMHGDADPRVNPEQSLEMYRYLKLAGKAPVRLVWYPGEKHGNKRAASQYDYSVRFMRWMDHYLKGPGGAPPAYEVDYSDKLKAD